MSVMLLEHLCVNLWFVLRTDVIVQEWGSR